MSLIRNDLFLYAIVCGAVDDAKSMLAAGGVDPNAVTREVIVPDWVPLRDHASIERNALSRAGDTALHLAVRHDRAELVPALIRAGANWRTNNRSGQTPVELACEKDMVNSLGAMMHALSPLEARDLAFSNSSFHTHKDALGVAISCNSPDVARFLLGFRSPVDPEGLYTPEVLSDRVRDAIFSRSARVFVELAKATGFDPTSKIGKDTVLSYFRDGGRELVKEYQQEYKLAQRMKSTSQAVESAFDEGAEERVAQAPRRARGFSL